MKAIDCENVMFPYTAQFGNPASRGAGYLYQMLRKYVAYGFSTETADYNLLLKEVSEEKGISPISLKRSIKRSILNGWSSERAETWKRVTGWNKDSPPHVGIAIRLVCESFEIFETNFINT